MFINCIFVLIKFIINSNRDYANVIIIIKITNVYLCMQYILMKV